LIPVSQKINLSLVIKTSGLNLLALQLFNCQPVLPEQIDDTPFTDQMTRTDYYEALFPAVDKSLDLYRHFLFRESITHPGWFRAAIPPFFLNPNPFLFRSKG